MYATSIGYIYKYSLCLYVYLDVLYLQCILFECRLVGVCENNTVFLFISLNFFFLNSPRNFPELNKSCCRTVRIVSLNMTIDS